MRSWNGAARLRALWQEVTDSLWFLPALITLGAGALAVLLVNVDAGIDAEERSELWWLFGGGAEGARGVLGAIAGSIITVTGVVFSVTIVALQLASSQFTPRVLRQFMGSRPNQVVLGVFIGTFTYTLLVQRTVRGATDDVEVFVPALAVTGAVLLALVSIGFLIFFINHAARSIQASVVIDNIARDTLRVLALTYPEEPAIAADAPPGPARPIGARTSGYIQAIAYDALLRTASDRDLVVRVERMPGDFVLEAQPLLAAWRTRADGSAEAAVLDEDAAEELIGTLHVGMERTSHQDVRFGVIELTDVAVKALSPSINDPTTAINVIDRLGEVLLALARCPPPGRARRDDAGVARVLLTRPDLSCVLDLAVNQLRHFAAGTPAVAVRLIDMLGAVSSLAPASARACISTHIRQVLDAALRSIEDPHDRIYLSTSAQRALTRDAMEA